MLNYESEKIIYLGKGLPNIECDQHALLYKTQYKISYCL